MFICGMYGTARDDLIARSKLVLNINKHASRIFEIVRVSYLLANGKAVVADRTADTYVEPDIEDGVAFGEPGAIARICEELLDDDDKRRSRESRGQAVIERRIITPLLAAALASHPA
jgi:hypothetical protein